MVFSYILANYMVTFSLSHRLHVSSQNNRYFSANRDIQNMWNGMYSNNVLNNKIIIIIVSKYRFEIWASYLAKESADLKMCLHWYATS